jgi:hypothetical protein
MRRYDCEIKKSVETARIVKNELSNADIRQVLLMTSNNNKLLYGLNYWQSIAADLLASSEEFLSSL